MPYTIIGDIQKLEMATNKATMSNPCFILTLNNEVLIGSDIVVQSGYAKEPIVILPESMRPTELTVIPIVYGSSNTKTTSWTNSYICITPDGELLWNANASGTRYLKTNGLSFNVLSRYYNDTIGNNFFQGTSPLSEV